MKTWQPTMNIVDEAACANPLELLIPLATFDTIQSVVYGGDHEQLPAFLVSEEAMALWKKTFFEELMDRKWPTTLLNVQYRCHSDAAEAAYHVIYADRVSAHWQTGQPARPFFKDLSSALPIRFSANGREYALTTYLNYVNVAGAEQGPEKGSKFNMAEVNVVIAMLQSFLDRGFTGRSIAVVTGYTLQFVKIQEALRALHTADTGKGWNTVTLVTANTVQAEEYEIVILSLVKTQGSRGFIEQKQRANVVCTRHREAMYFVSIPFHSYYITVTVTANILMRSHEISCQRKIKWALT